MTLLHTLLLFFIIYFFSFNVQNYFFTEQNPSTEEEDVHSTKRGTKHRRRQSYLDRLHLDIEELHKSKEELLIEHGHHFLKKKSIEDKGNNVSIYVAT